MFRGAHRARIYVSSRNIIFAAPNPPLTDTPTTTRLPNMVDFLPTSDAEHKDMVKKTKPSTINYVAAIFA